MASQIPLESKLDVTPVSTISTFQSPNEIANTIINAVLITLTVVNINSIISKLVHLTHKDRFQYSTFLRVYIFHNSDDPAQLWSWLRQSHRDKDDPQCRNYKIKKRRLIAPITARAIIFLATLGSIAISIPQDKKLNGCGQGDWYPDFNRFILSGVVEVRELDRPVCKELPMETNLGTVRTRANYCSFPRRVPLEPFEGSAIVVGYNDTTGSLYSGIQSNNGDGPFELQGTLSYVEWVNEDNDNFRAKIRDWRADKHIVIVHDAITHDGRQCDLADEEEWRTENEFVIAPVNCSFITMEMLKTVDAAIRNARKWERTGAILERILPEQGFRKTRQCPIDVVVSRPFLNMVPLGALLIFLFTLNLAVSFTTSERGEVLEQTFGLVKEVMGHDCTLGAIERSDEDDRQGIKIVERKKWVCAGGDGFHEGFLKGEGCDDVEEFSKDAIVRRCKYADGSGKRELNVCEDDTDHAKRNFLRRIFCLSPKGKTL